MQDVAYVVYRHSPDDEQGSPDMAAAEETKAKDMARRGNEVADIVGSPERYSVREMFAAGCCPVCKRLEQENE